MSTTTTTSREASSLRVTQGAKRATVVVWGCRAFVEDLTGKVLGVGPGVALPQA